MTGKNWYEDEGAIGRDRLRAILAGIEAPPPPLTRGQSVDVLATCYRAQGYLMIGAYAVFGPDDLDEAIGRGHVRASEEGIALAREAMDR